MSRLGASIGFLCAFWAALLAVSACTSEATPTNNTVLGCQNITYAQTGFTVCHYRSDKDKIRTFLNHKPAAPYGQFFGLEEALKAKGQALVFAMNGGMYHDDRSAVGLYIEDGKQIKNINTNKGPGNFHMMPNGVFYMAKHSAGVIESSMYLRANIAIDYATQSGPMLVIDGKLHPKFNKASTSKHIRNGVGVKGNDVYFVISNAKVNFHTFASLFKNYLKVPNALYLDGTVSKMYAPNLNRHDIGRQMGPIIAVVEDSGT